MARRTKHPWRTLYGSGLALVPDGGVLDSDGKATNFKLAVVWTHKPGDIFASGNGRRYSVRPDRSLRKI